MDADLVHVRTGAPSDQGPPVPMHPDPHPGLAEVSGRLLGQSLGEVPAGARVGEAPTQDDLVAQPTKAAALSATFSGVKP